MKIVMMGTGPFAVPTFKMLLDSEHDCCLLITRPQVINRGKVAPPGPMRVVGQECGIEIYDPQDANSEAAVQKLSELAPDLLVVCDYGQILSNEVLSTAKLGGINLHGSLLPKYRGAAPVQWSVYNGDAETGVCVIHMTPRLDGGPVLCETRTEIKHEDTAETLEDRLSVLGVKCVQDAIALLSRWDGETALGRAQDQSLATKAPRLKKQMGELDWERSAREIRNQIRAFKPWPGCYTAYQRSPNNEIRLIVDWVELVSTTDKSFAEFQPGQIVAVEKNLLWVKTGDGVLAIEKIQPVGKRLMNVDEFLRGYPMQIGNQLGDSSSLS